MIRAPRPQNRIGVAPLSSAAAMALFAATQLAVSADPQRAV